MEGRTRMKIQTALLVVTMLFPCGLLPRRMPLRNPTSSGSSRTISDPIPLPPSIASGTAMPTVRSDKCSRRISTDWLPWARHSSTPSTRTRARAVANDHAHRPLLAPDRRLRIRVLQPGRPAALEADGAGDPAGPGGLPDAHRGQAGHSRPAFRQQEESRRPAAVSDRSRLPKRICR